MYQRGRIVKLTRHLRLALNGSGAYEGTRRAVVGALVVLEYRQAKAVEWLGDAAVSLGWFVPQGLIGCFWFLPHGLLVGLVV